MDISRRQFLMGCSAAIAAMAGGRLTQLAFADQAELTAGTDEIFVMVFLRGGMDGLSLLAPVSDAIYQAKRRRLVLPTTGDFSSLPFNPNNPTYPGAGYFVLNQKASPLNELYSQGQLAFIHACGLDNSTRSHFDAMDYIERGTPGNKLTPNGWIARHLNSVGANSGVLPVLSTNTAAPTSLLGTSAPAAVGSPRSFAINGPARYNRREPANTRYPWADQAMLKSLERLYPASGKSNIEKVGTRTIETIKTIQAASVGNYTPSNGAVYPAGSFGSALSSIAQTVKLELGLRVATVDLGGWDTHENQGTTDAFGYFSRKIDELARGLHAFYTDMLAYHEKLTVVVMSEFGRRLGANASEGTDHGHGNVMMVLGGNVNGGKCYGSWPGLLDLDQDQDLKITTDYRVVLSEVITRRLGNNKLGYIFPGMTAANYTPLGIVSGADPGPIDWDPEPDLARLNSDQPDAEYRLFLPMLSNC
jgi:uncharacterized protein (DUF1501 family)